MAANGVEIVIATVGFMGGIVLLFPIWPLKFKGIRKRSRF